MEKSKQKRGRPKGATSFTELTLDELAKIFKSGDKIKVSRIQLDSIKNGVATEPTTTTDKDGF